MANKDRFGFPVGSISAKTAAMAARPEGVLMGTIDDEIGRTNYNAFKAAEKRGHTVIRKGKGRNMRIWLVHRDDEVPENLRRFAEGLDEDEGGIDNQEDEDALAEIASDDANGLTFALESDLQAKLRANLEYLEPGLEAIDQGREQNYRDITARDKDGNIVVIELKAGTANAKAVAQILAYMGEAKSEVEADDVGIRGILVASNFQEKAYFAASMAPDLSLVKYRYHFTFERV